MSTNGWCSHVTKSHPVEEVNEEHDRPKGTPNDDPKPSTTYQSKPKPPPLEPTTPNPKRKYAENNGLPPPSTKKVKRHRSPDGNQEPEFVPVIELEDVTAEVDARIRAKDEKKGTGKSKTTGYEPKAETRAHGSKLDPRWAAVG